MYLKRIVTPEDLDSVRLNLSVWGWKLSAEPTCDFCGDPTPKFLYASIYFQAGERIPNWRWMVCESCSGHLDRNNWKPIEAKIVTYLKQSGFANAPERALQRAAMMALNDFIFYARERS